MPLQPSAMSIELYIRWNKYVCIPMPNHPSYRLHPLKTAVGHVPLRLGPLSPRADNWNHWPHAKLNVGVHFWAQHNITGARGQRSRGCKINLIWQESCAVGSASQSARRVYIFPRETSERVSAREKLLPLLPCPAYERRDPAPPTTPVPSIQFLCAHIVCMRCYYFMRAASAAVCFCVILYCCGQITTERGAWCCSLSVTSTAHAHSILLLWQLVEPHLSRAHNMPVGAIYLFLQYCSNCAPLSAQDDDWLAL